jgi:hypothetical protein
MKPGLKRAIAGLLVFGSVSLAEAPKPAVEVGAAIPRFEAQDQFGQRRTFDSIKGRRGTFILFHRSADW